MTEFEARSISINSVDDDASHPRKHQPTSVPAAVFSVVCTCLGAGILSLPSALGQCGWVGLIIIVLVAVLANHTSKLLIASVRAMPGQNLHTYEDMGLYCFGPRGAFLVGVLQQVTLVGVCTVFLILIGGNMNALVPQLTMHVWVFVFAGLLIPIAWLKTIKEVSVLAYFGSFASFFVAFIVIIMGFSDSNPTHHTTGEKYVAQHTFADWNGLSSAFNLIVFSFGGHNVFPSIAVSMKNPNRWPLVSNISFSIIASMYMLAGAAGYYGWGSEVSGNALDSMQAGHVAVKLARIFVTAHVVLAYPLPLNPVAHWLEALLGINRLPPSKELPSRVIMRTGLVLFTVFLASVIPFFGDFLSLISALSVIGTVFFLPALFYYVLYRRTGDISPAHKCVLVLCLVIGALGTGFGIYYSIKALINDFKNNPSPFDNFFTN